MHAAVALFDGTVGNSSYTRMEAAVSSGLEGHCNGSIGAAGCFLVRAWRYDQPAGSRRQRLLAFVKAMAMAMAGVSQSEQLPGLQFVSLRPVLQHRPFLSQLLSGLLNPVPAQHARVCIARCPRAASAVRGPAGRARSGKKHACLTTPVNRELISFYRMRARVVWFVRDRAVYVLFRRSVYSDHCTTYEHTPHTPLLLLLSTSVSAAVSNRHNITGRPVL